MLSIKDYSQLTREEFASEEKKMKSRKTTAALFMGVLVGIAAWSATHKGGLLTYLLLLGAILIGRRTTQETKSVQSEKNRRDTVV